MTVAVSIRNDSSEAFSFCLTNLTYRGKSFSLGMDWRPESVLNFVVSSIFLCVMKELNEA